MSDLPKQELARIRTDWANERTLLAKERTFSAWVRTGLAAMAAGLGITRLLSELQPLWMVRTLGAVFLLLGIAALGIGFWSYNKTVKQLEEEGIRGVPVWFIGGFSLVLVGAATLGLILIIWQ